MDQVVCFVLGGGTKKRKEEISSHTTYPTPTTPLDGFNWSPIPPLLNRCGSFSSISAIQYSGNLFLVSGVIVPSNVLPFAWSTDGQNFTCATISNNVTTSVPPSALVLTPTTGWLAASGPVFLRGSPDATSWSPIPAQGYILSTVFGLTRASDLGTVVAVGVGRAGGLGIATSDDDGTTWIPVIALDASAAFPTALGGVGRAVVYNSFSQRFFAVGSSPVLCYSNDLGRSWTTVPFPQAAIRQASGIVFR